MDIQKNFEALKKRHSKGLTNCEEKEHLAKKNGRHSKVYSINGDSYIGEYKNDLKHGNGTYFYKTNGKHLTKDVNLNLLI